MKIVIALALISFNVFAIDNVTQSLIEENKILEQRIEKNNTFIASRKSVSLTSIDSNEKLLKKSSMIGLGLERMEWGDAIVSQLPTLSFTYIINKYWLQASFGRVVESNFPINSAQTAISAYRLMAKYNIDTAIDGLSVQPTIGFLNYSIDSPDLGLSYYESVNKYENDVVLSVEDRSGIFAGIGLAKSFGDNWLATIRGDISLSYNFQIAYRL